MKTNILKILSIATIMIFLGAGVSLADGWKNENGKRGHAYGHCKHGGYPHYRYCSPRPVYVEHHYRPVVVARYYYPAPVYAAPAPPSGYYFGMSVMEPGVGFSFGVSGR